MLRGTDDARAGASARPGMLHGPGLEMGVRQPIFCEHLAGPVIGLLELGRAGEAWPNVVRKIFEIGHQFAVLANFAENLRVGDGDEIFFVAAGAGQASAHGNHGGDATEHKNADSTQVHSSTSTEFLKFALMFSTTLGACSRCLPLASVRRAPFLWAFRAFCFAAARA